MALLGNVITVKDASMQMNIAEQTMRSLLVCNDLPCQKIGNQWMTTMDSLSKVQKIRPVADGIVQDKKHGSSMIPAIKAMSFFSGAMGLDIGMSNSGIDAVLACEFDKHCRNTISTNRTDIGLIGDIKKYSVDQIFDFANLPRNERVDVMFGGPPCQAFSTAGARKAFGDERGNIFLKYLDIIEEIKPTYVIIENVRGLISATLNFDCSYKNDEYDFSKIPADLPGGALLLILNRLRDAGYSVSFNLYNAANFGAPQNRERIVIIGYHGKKAVPYLTPTHAENGAFGLLPWRTLGEVIGGMDTSDIHSLVFPENRLKYYRLLKEGENWKNLSDEMQKEAMGKSYYLGGGKTGFYRRLSFSKPSPTLVTHPAMPATDLCHPIEDRPLSIEEYKRIQEFPDHWKICGSLAEQYKQIGNAVPIKLAEAIGKAIIDHMNGVNVKPISGFPYSRYKGCTETAWEANIKTVIKKRTTSHSG